MKLLFISLGCDKNLVDTETMLGILAKQGYKFTDNEMEADIIVVNTCCFIHDAKEESIQTILEMAEHRKSGICKALIVAGCLSQRYKDEILTEIEEVDAIIGTTNYDDIHRAIVKALEGKRQVLLGDLDALPIVREKRIVTTGGHYAYLKIAEGCDKHCTYCVIPKVRGNYRSMPAEFLIEQAKDLAEQGIQELILVAQETTMYGIDLYGEKSLPRLLRALCQIRGLRWIRILYCYPEEITPELVAIMKEEEKICHYLDIPIQHVNDHVLRRMGRKMTKEQLVSIIHMLRKEIPDIALRTTLITGFPGETKEQHEEVMEFVNAMEFDRLGVFTYSAEEDTPAMKMEGQLEEDIKSLWRDEIMELQQEIAFDKGEEMIGKELTVMIEGRISEEDAYVGRTYQDAPDIDGYIFVNTDEELMSGDFVKVRVTASVEYDLIGEIVNEFTQ